MKKGAVSAVLAALALLYVGTVVADASSSRRAPYTLSKVWDTTDHLLLGVAVTSLIVDWSQTRYIAHHPEQFFETNQYLGRHPSAGEVNTYFAAYTIITVAVARTLPSRYRKWWLAGISLVELDAIRGNVRLGIRMNF